MLKPISFFTSLPVSTAGVVVALAPQRARVPATTMTSGWAERLCSEIEATEPNANPTRLVGDSSYREKSVISVAQPTASKDPWCCPESSGESR